MLGAKTICLLEERRVVLLDIGISSEILGTTLRTKGSKIKIRKWTTSKPRDFEHQRAPSIE